MLAVVFKNPELSAKRLSCSKGAIYSWLNGHTPNLSLMMRVHEVYKIPLTLSYMYNFFNVVRHALEVEELDGVLEYIKISALTPEDKTFLSEHFKTKYWKQNG